MSLKDFEIPQYIDSFPQIIWFEVDELMPFMACFGAGTFLHMMSVMLVAGCTMTWYYMKYKRTALDGALLHMLYWWGLMGLNGSFKNGLMREWIE